MPGINYKDILKKQLKDEEFKKEYDALKDEFDLLNGLLKARNEANLTQASLATKMGIKQSAVARIESGKLDIKYSTILSYLNACGKKIAII
ncbi:MULTISPECIES: helix-turn-helix domain-containing protein [Campylobacter]|uniref:helix-turn-helix domain-containing protein n=1 Tax=Campylobacter TaxID=194 RepID=UPI0019D20A45|nr:MULTISPECIES: helix-turn-helix transcriptional regulator [Campylobacter]MBN7287974.1 helix-turn-helix transcriptional regulator [Campylobacter curvus]MDU6827530.1 helix-turn-helix transcriptional regulator [Campylobacter sp.]